MTGTVQAGIGYLALAGTTGVLFVRYAVTGGTSAKHRGGRRARRVEEYVPGHVLIPALAGETFAHHRDHATTGD